MNSYKLSSILYLHGLASSPNSKKACAIGEASSKLGIPFNAPDLSVPTFESLSLNAQLDLVKRVAKDLPSHSALIGSSFGGFLALNALKHSESLAQSITKLVLIAPVIDWRNSKALSPQIIAHWRREGFVKRFHSGTNTERMLPWSFFEEISQFGMPTLPPSLHCLIIHGYDDEVLDFKDSEKFAKAHQDQVEFVGLQGGHELLSSIPQMVEHVTTFLKSPLPDFMR